MATRLSQNSTSPISYQDYLRNQAQSTLKDLEPTSTYDTQPIDDLLATKQAAVLKRQSKQMPQFDMSGYDSQGSAQMRLPQTRQGGILGAAGQVTQRFGANNPGVEVFSHGFNSGTDIGVPVGTPVAVPPGKWQVVESYSNDTHPGHIGDGTNSGYGNSVLVQNTQTGEKMRFSHLSQNAAQPGMTLNGGQVFGATGATGNVTGPHLDLEYYNQNGKLDDVLNSMYSQYLMGQGGGEGARANGEGGGNPLMDMINGAATNYGRVNDDFKNKSNDFMHLGMQSMQRPLTQPEQQRYSAGSKAMDVSGAVGMTGVNPAVNALDKASVEELSNLRESLLHNNPLDKVQADNLSRTMGTFFSGFNPDFIANKQLGEMLGWAIDNNLQLPKAVKQAFPKVAKIAMRK